MTICHDKKASHAKIILQFIIDHAGFRNRKPIKKILEYSRKPATITCDQFDMQNYLLTMRSFFQL